MTKEVIERFTETQKAFTQAARDFGAVVGKHDAKPSNIEGYVTILASAKYWHALQEAAAAADAASSAYVAEYRADEAAKAVK